MVEINKMRLQITYKVKSIRLLQQRFRKVVLLEFYVYQ